MNVTLSGYLGGYSNQDDDMVVTATFLDGSGGQLGSPVQIGPVTAADRADVTTLLARSTSGAVPPRTRSIRVTMTATRFQGTANDGEADNLSLSLTGASGQVAPTGSVNVTASGSAGGHSITAAAG